MQGRTHRRLSWCWLLLTCSPGFGCGDARPESPADATPAAAERTTHFDSASAGTVTGCVTWVGPLPTVAPLTGWVGVPSEGGGGVRVTRENPNAPAVDPRTGAVCEAVLFLRGVDPQRARPWDHPPVRVALRDYCLQVGQGDAQGHIGFVRRGDVVEMVSAQQAFHSMSARGAAFFSVAFPDAQQSLSRPLNRKGLVELTSGAGCFWMRGYLFVDEHPYFARTDAAGRFRLPQVPPGSYELVCWMPNWHEESHERNSETGMVWRMNFHPPVELVRPVTVTPGTTQDIELSIPAGLFGR